MNFRGNQTVWGRMLHQGHINFPAFESPITIIQQMTQLLSVEAFWCFIEQNFS